MALLISVIAPLCAPGSIGYCSFPLAWVALLLLALLFSFSEAPQRVFSVRMQPTAPGNSAHSLSVCVLIAAQTHVWHTSPLSGTAKTGSERQMKGQCGLLCRDSEGYFWIVSAKSDKIPSELANKRLLSTSESGVETLGWRAQTVERKDASRVLQRMRGWFEQTLHWWSSRHRMEGFFGLWEVTFVVAPFLWSLCCSVWGRHWVFYCIGGEQHEAALFSLPPPPSIWSRQRQCTFTHPRNTISPSKSAAPHHSVAPHKPIPLGFRAVLTLRILWLPNRTIKYFQNWNQNSFYCYCAKKSTMK